MKSAFPKQEWTNHALAMVQKFNLPSLMMKARDFSEWFIGSSGHAPEELAVHLLAAMCKYESGFNPNETYHEQGALDGVTSTGLLQVSKDSVAQARYGGYRTTTEGLKDPFLNIEIAAKILSYWVEEDGVISSTSRPWLGGGRYWSVLRHIENRDGTYKDEETKATLQRYLKDYPTSGEVPAGEVPGSAPTFERTLKMGMEGEDVRALQEILIKRGWLHITNTTTFFGTLTDKAVKQFQAAQNLVVDGKVGPITWKALFLGVVTVDPPPVLNNEFPEVPESREDIVRIFGKNIEGGSHAWEAENLRFCEVPSSLTVFPMKDGKRGFTCHRKAIPVFQAAFNEIVAKGLEHLIYSWDGCYNPRKITGGSNLSFHAYGIAIDFDYDGNEYGDSTPAMDPRIVAIFKKYFCSWGGDYTGNKDGMHFEIFKRRI